MTELITVLAPLSVLAGGILAVVKFIDQRKRELDEKRFEQYWKILNISQESEHLAKQAVALLLLKRFPDYAAETIEFLENAKNKKHPWAEQNAAQINSVLTFLKRV